MEYPIFRIRDLALEDRPREKGLRQGLNGLSNTELLAILIGTGTKKQSALDLARLLLQKAGNDLHHLGKLTLPELEKISGIGEVKAIRIQACFELSRRRKATPPAIKPKIRCSQDAWKLLEGSLSDLQHEEFWILLLNRSNQIIDQIRISQGGISGTVTDVRLILNAAVEKLASGIILAHNHPSGNLSPSDADLKITKKIKEAASMLDLSLLDHLILSDQGYLSMADDNLMP
ncbi:MAG: DNA repair protein RadC [Bacteroidales bacterium]|nr:DNA repair protein RadC [Bacteroidales bacterium]